MGIDLQTEQTLSLTEATRAVPGYRPAASTVWRWCRRGLRGVNLEYARLGNRIVTSREALTRFANRLAELDAEDYAATAILPKTRTRTARRRERDIEHAESKLRSVGLL